MCINIEELNSECREAYGVTLESAERAVGGWKARYRLAGGHIPQIGHNK